MRRSPPLALFLVLLLLGDPARAGSGPPSPPPPIGDPWTDPTRGRAYGFLDPEADGKDVEVFVFQDGKNQGSRRIPEILAYSLDMRSLDYLDANPRFMAFENWRRYASVAEAEAGLAGRKAEIHAPGSKEGPVEWRAELLSMRARIRGLEDRRPPLPTSEAALLKTLRAGAAFHRKDEPELALRLVAEALPLAEALAPPQVRQAELAALRRIESGAGEALRKPGR